jgi:NAD(P)-dependent dehydrogenase (short-subunit alcohol dehydrogenase family)
MAGVQLFGYEGKRILVVGGATGLGAAAATSAADLGAEVMVMDRVPVAYPVTREIRVDLADLAALDAAINQVDGPVDAVFAAADSPAGPHAVRVSYIAHRHLIERMTSDGTLGPGSAVCLRSATAGLGWQQHLELLTDFLAAPGYAAADKWITEHEGTDTYTFSKQAINAYVARAAHPLLARGIRINAICPELAGIPGSLADERISTVMLFLNSAAAKGITGVSLLVDDGHLMSCIGDPAEPVSPVIKFLMTGTSR